MAPRTSLILALAALGACVAPAAEAAVYAMVRAEPDAITVMDPAAIETTPGSDSLRRAYSVTVQKTLTSEGPQQPGYVRTLNEYDCAQRKVRWKSFWVYSRFGDLVIHKDNVDGTWSPTPAGSEAEASTRLVCDHANKWAAVAAGSISQLVIGLMQAWDEAAQLPPLQPVKPLPPKKPAIRKTAKAPQA
ncbi:surface-adhesin E family protein [Phenylobacterium sp.]|jgi:hypothetical protein|uniref:surface-adhesin E family protein n=1 Tax=Phenylobacterium sp. TaxID=1871053 RepID=UPI001229CCBE|nr:surface-adhesin E family protein [Phenylobacterium sp.]THD57235.1 MAG: hypothetical protein E8A12_13710 [Phenylobacterium sp.]